MFGEVFELTYSAPESTDDRLSYEFIMVIIYSVTSMQIFMSYLDVKVKEENVSSPDKKHLQNKLTGIISF